MTDKNFLKSLGSSVLSGVIVGALFGALMGQYEIDSVVENLSMYDVLMDCIFSGYSFVGPDMAEFGVLGGALAAGVETCLYWVFGWSAQGD